MQTMLTEKQTRIVKELCVRHDPDPGHAVQVTKLSLKIFDDLKKLHSLEQIDRKILEIAAMLHDAGWVSGTSRKHHKRSRDIIRKAEIDGMDSHPMELAAQVARYHRKALPNPEKHQSFNRLPPEDKNRVEWLAAILRIADGLDRSHVDRVDDVEIDIMCDVLEFTLFSERSCTNEIWGARRKKELLETKSKRRVEFRVQ